MCRLLKFEQIPLTLIFCDLSCKYFAGCTCIANSVFGMLLKTQNPVDISWNKIEKIA